MGMLVGMLNDSDAGRDTATSHDGMLLLYVNLA
jgi:hypothetical protein